MIGKNIEENKRVEFERLHIKCEEFLVGKQYYIADSDMLNDKPDMNGLGLFYRGIYEKDFIGITHGFSMMNGEDADTIDSYHFAMASVVLNDFLDTQEYGDKGKE